MIALLHLSVFIAKAGDNINWFKCYGNWSKTALTKVKAYIVVEAKYAALSGECHFLSFTSVEAVGAKQLIVYKDRYRHLSEWCGL